MYKKTANFPVLLNPNPWIGRYPPSIQWHLSLRRRCYEEGPNPQSTWPKKLRSSGFSPVFGWFKIIDSTFSTRHQKWDMLVYREFLLCLPKIRRWRWGRDVMVDDLKLQILCHLLGERWRCGTEVEYTISTDHLVSFWKTSRGWQADRLIVPTPSPGEPAKTEDRQSRVRATGSTERVQGVFCHVHSAQAGFSLGVKAVVPKYLVMFKVEVFACLLAELCI